jgi:HD-GYP domain-containing protein (c-di-GMP phosphodiesterase class II)
MLRRIVYSALDQMNESNRQLSGLLRASRSLSNAQHENEASESVVHSAIALSDAHAACVFLRNKGDDSLKMTASAGASGPELYESLIEPIVDLVDQVMKSGELAIRRPCDGEPDSDEFQIRWGAVVPLPGEKMPLGALVAIHTDPGSEFDTPQLNALATLAGLASVAMANAELRFAQRNFFSHVTDILVTAIDVHLGYHTGHGRRVAHLANQLGRRLELSDTQREHLHFASLLHDIGMLKIDRADPPHSAKTCRKHPVYGYRMLHGIRLWDDVAPLVLYHHERFDGTGYPEGLAGDAIPLEARIIALCEAFDSMTAPTSYKDPLSFDDAVREVSAGSGSQFDPDVVQAFMDILEDARVASQLVSPTAGASNAAVS